MNTGGMVCRHRRQQPASSAHSELVLQPREEAKHSEMSLSNKQPASLSEYSQLCKGKNTESFSEAFHCMESPKDFSKTEFEWQRTEGKLNEIGLNVNSGPIKDGLVKNAGFTDEDKLCFFEGKLDKELKIAQKDKREIEVQGKKHQAAAGHLESWSLISETFPSAEGNFANPKTTDFHVGQAGAEKPGSGLGKNEAITDQEKAVSKAGMESKCQPDPNLPSVSVSESDPSKYMKEQEISVWNPNFHPILPNDSGSKEATVKKGGAPSYCVIGVVNDNYVQSGFSSSSTASKPEPPTTTVELAQDDSKSSYFNNTTEMEEEMEDKLSCADDGNFLNRAAHQRKAMRRAMSESSHLSVPLTLNLADKYPEPVLREDVATGLLSPNSSLTQCSSPTARKPGAPMKRSMTVAEEQTSVCSLGTEQSRAGLPSLVVKEHQALPAEEPAAKKREEWNSSSNSVKKELGSPSLYHSKLEQIPEISSQDKEREEEVAVKKEKRNATDGAAGLESPKSKCNEMESSKTALLERKEIEVSNVQSSPSPKQGDLPRDAKPEETKPVEAVTGNDITAPPNKELPPSPEKKTKPATSTSSTKPAATKARPLSATSPKRPPSATPGLNKKPTSPTAGPTSATTTKRPTTSTTRPSTLAPKETKPKVADAKTTDKRTSLSKPPTSATSKTTVRSSPVAPKTTAASPVAAAAAAKNTATSPPKRPTSIKTDAKPADAKKTTAKSPSADVSRPKSATGNAVKSSTTTPTTSSSAPALPGVATSRPKPKPAATKPTTTSTTTADAKKPTAKVPAKPSIVSKPPRPTSSASAPDLKNVRSKIGSTDNIKHQPGGGKGKIEKRPESAAAARKSEPNVVSKMATTKTTVSKEGTPKQPNGKVQIVSKKANYSHVQSKCGSKDNIKHVPGGGNVQIQNKKVDLSKVSSKCGSKANIKHKPGGGDVKIENQKLNFKEKAQAKVGSLDNVGHLPAGGTVKAEGSAEPEQLPPAPQNGEVTAAQAGSEMRENGVGPAVPTALSGGDQREIQSFETQIQETN
ncbi:microtubule-associated protein 4-like [Strigops habroptila]|uniref:microtubule-associated protein 4-like n=1 Tax=Strigops habroptila TaxID=2489341 RepID=UPI0011CEE86D|nr:microtubule-associated protein 4-like [Strigops habroptila]